MSEPPHLPWPWLVLPAAAAIALFAPSLAGGFLSDDLMIDLLADRTGGGFAVRWGEVLADFGRPWLGLDSPYYRPLLSASFALDLAIGAGDPAPFHVTNVWLHAASTFLTALLCVLCCPDRPRLAALLGGLLFAVHPIACEPVCWIAARNSELEVALRMAALTAFAGYLVYRARLALVVCVAAALAALAAKESAVLLAPGLLALDLLLRPADGARARARRQLAFAPLWLGYAALRVAVVGTAVGAVEGDLEPARLAANAGAKLAALFVPTGSSLPLGGWLWPLLATWALALALGLRRGRRAALVVGAAWLAVHVAPTFHIPLHDNLGGARVLYGAVGPLAVVLCTLLWRGVGAPAAWLAAAAMTAAVTGLADVSDRHQRHFAAGWDDVAAAAAGIARAAPLASPERPLALLSMPKNRHGVPVLNENAFFPLAEVPRQAADVPVVGLGFVTLEVPRSLELFQDAGPVRALRRHGCALLRWDSVRRRLDATPPAPAAALPVPTADPDRPGRFVLDPLLDPYGVEMVVVRTAGESSGGELRWLTAHGPATAALRTLEFGNGRPAEGGTEFRIDVTHSLGLLAWAELGVGIDDLVVTVDGGAAVAAVELVAALPELPLPARLGGRTIAPADLEAALVPPATELPLRLVLLGPPTGFAMRVEPGTPLAVPAAIRSEIETFARVARQNRYLFYWETIVPPGSPGAARSAIDWLTVPGR